MSGGAGVSGEAARFRPTRGRGRPRRDPPQRRRPAARRRRADGGREGERVRPRRRPGRAGGARGGRDLARRGARRGGARRCARPGSRRRSWCSRSSRPGAEAVALGAPPDPDASTPTPALAPAAPPRPGGRGGGAREGRHRHAPGGRVAARGRRRRSSPRGRRGRPRPRGPVDPLRDAARTTRSRRRLSWTGSPAVVEAARAAGFDAAVPARVEQRRAACVTRRRLRPGAARDRALRDPAGARGRRGLGAAPGAVVAVGASRWRSACRPASGSATASATSSSGRVDRDGAGRLRRRLPADGVVAGRRPDRGPPLPRRGQRDDGPADGRLRRRARSRPATRSCCSARRETRTITAWELGRGAPARSPTRSSRGSATRVPREHVG